MLQTLLNVGHANVVPRLPKEFEKGQVYTPKFLASWVSMLLKEQLGPKWSGNLLDPACGDGELLVAFRELFPQVRAMGVDIDPKACAAARKRLGSSALLKTADMLDMNCLDSSAEFQEVDAIISNPPWGADILNSPIELRNAGYRLASGQFDSWSVFVEKSLSILRNHGLAAFILPDAIFSLEHASIRKLITENFSILMIARLGEGIFDGVCRGTTVLLIRKERPNSSHEVEAFRLPKSKRSLVVAGKYQMKDLRKLESHMISQCRFMADPNCQWDIDVRSSEQGILGKMEKLGGSWADHLVSGRGVELSKRGVVKRCGDCGRAIPVPTSPRIVECFGCGAVAHSEEMQLEKIVESDSFRQKGFMSFIVGEDVGRYSLSCSRKLKLGVPGINYKNENVYSKERLLIRKTGIGLKATITNRVAISNQVVFHYMPKTEKNRFFLYYVLGVISSRVMFAYHLKKSGENEWRSHPYVTPSSLRSLPIPVPVRGTQMWNQAKAISDQVDTHLRAGGHSLEQDLKIEGLVAGLYHFDKRDIEWTRSTICSAQNLEAVRALGDFDTNSVRPKIIK